MEWFSKLFDLAKVPTKFIGAAASVCAVVLLVPELVLESLMLLRIREDFGPYFGFGLLISSSILLIKLGIWLYNSARSHYAGQLMNLTMAGK